MGVGTGNKGHRGRRVEEEDRTEKNDMVKRLSAELMKAQPHWDKYKENVCTCMCARAHAHVSVPMIYGVDLSKALSPCLMPSGDVVIISRF